MKKIQLHLTGISPLLMHSTAGMNVVNDGLKTRSSHITGEEEAEMGAYRNPDGSLCFPTIGVLRSLWDAASGIKVGKLTARKALAGLLLQEEFGTLTDDLGTPLTKFEVDQRFVKVGTARVPRCRAKILEWQMVVNVEYDPNLLTIQAIEELLNRAGSLVGIGDYRPSTGGGPFGRFSGTVVQPSA